MNKAQILYGNKAKKEISQKQISDEIVKHQQDMLMRKLNKARAALGVATMTAKDREIKSKTEKEQPRTHAHFAPSSFKNRELCPQFNNVQKPNAASDEGTLLHEMLEKPNDKALRKKATLAQLGLIKMIEEYVAPFTKNAKQVLNEVRLDLTSLSIMHCSHGTVDKLILQTDEEGHLMDYKLGLISVDDPEHNIQIQIYVVGAFANFPKLKKITAHIIQPKTDEIGVHEFYRETDFDRIVTRARAIALKAADPLSPPKAHTGLCKFCTKYHQNCPAVTSLVSQADLPNDDAIQRPTSSDFANFENDNEAATKVFMYAKFLEEYGKSLKDKISELAVLGKIDVFGHFIVNNQGKTKIVQVHDAFDLLKNKYGLTFDMFLSACDVNLTDLGEVVSQQTDKPGKEAKAEVLALLSGNGLTSSSNGFSYLRKK